MTDCKPMETAETPSRPVVITFAAIRACSPCADGWEILTKSLGGICKFGLKTEFALSHLLDSNGLDDTLWCLRALPEHSNLWRKYAVWCARRVQHLMTDARSIHALDVAWKHSDGIASDNDLAASRDAAWDASRDAAWDASRDAQAAKLRQILTAGVWVND